MIDINKEYTCGGCRVSDLKYVPLKGDLLPIKGKLHKKNGIVVERAWTENGTLHPYIPSREFDLFPVESELTIAAD